MALEDLLTQEEIDALLHGIDEGTIETGTDQPSLKGIRPYDFSRQDRIVRGRMPTLEMINERFVRYFRVSLFNLMRRAVEVSVVGIQVLKFSEFIYNQFVPTNLNLIRFKPLHGRALIVMDPTLVFAAVDSYFGGSGRFYNKVEGRDFTPMEMRLIRILLDLAFKDLREAWKPVLDVQPEYLHSELNPQFINIVGPSDIVVNSTIRIEVEGMGGNFHFVLPYSMIEPIRDLLDTIHQSDREDVDMRWRKALHYEIMTTQLEVYAILLEKKMNLAQILRLRPGDILSVEMPEYATLYAEGVPLFYGQVGIANGNYALKIVQKAARYPDTKPSALLIDKT